MKKRKLFITNIFFENELLEEKKTLQEYFTSHPLYLQLQYLPILYKEPEDAVLVTDLPENELQKRSCLYTYDNLPKQSFTVESWGSSEVIRSFCKEHGLCYEAPSYTILKKVHAKSYTYPDHLGIEILYSKEDVLLWIQKGPYPKVLKENFSFSGRGNFLIKNSDQTRSLSHFLKKAVYPLRAEPWLHRTLDFSSQWEIDKNKNIHLQGVTGLVNSKKGAYHKTVVCNPFPKNISYIDEHLAAATPILQNIASSGYFGPIGLDSFLYDTKKLYPICEINARMTMSCVALKIQQKHYPNQSIYFSYQKGNQGLLPKRIGKHTFDRQISIQEGGSSFFGLS